MNWIEDEAKAKTHPPLALSSCARDDDADMVACRLSVFPTMLAQLFFPPPTGENLERQNTHNNNRAMAIVLDGKRWKSGATSYMHIFFL